MSERDVIGTCFVVFLVIGLFGIFIYQNSIQNDFGGDIKIVAEGKYIIQRDCFGDPTTRNIGRFEIPVFYQLYKVPQSRGESGVDYSWGKLVEGKSYILYEKGNPLWITKTYFIECLSDNGTQKRLEMK